MDIAIVGTGISSMLLAQALIRRGCFDTLRIIGPRRPARAHRLSYWSDAPTPFDAHADASWSALRVTAASGQHVSVPLSRLSYRSFRAGTWLSHAMAEVLAAPCVEWVKATVDRVTDEGDAAIVRLGDRSLRADWVFSSVRISGTPSCWQRFSGWELEIEDPELDTTTATLLDFRTPAAGDFRFLYKLPLGPRRLFIEHVSYQPCDHAAYLRAYLRDVLQLTRFHVVDREAGATPLFRDRPVRQTGRVVNIGVAGGLAKTTTGYAVTRMWRDAEQIADAMLRLGHPAIQRRPPFLYRLADHFFLDLLARVPERIPQFMGTLFSRVAGDAVLSFLDDRARLRQKLAVAFSMPGWLRWWLWGRL